MADSKSIAGLSPNLAAAAALARLLKARLQAVQQRVRAVSVEPKTIHQLRVSTRRAAAALRLAKGHLPPRKRQAATALLRDLRRAAGRVRDHDIYIQAVERSPIGEVPKAFLVGLRAYRRWIDYQVLQAQVQLLKNDLARLVQKLPGSLKPGKAESFQRLVHRAARQLFVQFHQAVTDAGQQLDPEHLHRVRIQAKRLRYTLEVCPGDNRRVAAIRGHVERLQEILGDWHDAHTLIPKFEASAQAATSVNGQAGSPVARAITTLTRDARRREVKQLSLFRRWLATWTRQAERTPPKVLFPK